MNYIIFQIIFHIILVNLSIICSFGLRFSFELPEYNFSSYTNVWMVYTVIQIIIFYFFGLYEKRRTFSSADILYAVLNSVTVGFIFLASVSFYARGFSFPRSVIVISWLLSLISIALFQLTLLHYQRKHESKINILIIGYSDQGHEIAHDIRQFSSQKFNIVGFIDSEQGEIENQYLGRISDMKKIVEQHGVDIGIVVAKNLMSAEVFDIIFTAEECALELKILPGLYEIMIGKVQMTEIAGIPLMDIGFYRVDGPVWKLKRIIDIIVSFIGLVLCIPVFIITAIAIKLTSKGSILYVQQRCGKNRKLFNIYKFRSMIENAEHITGPVWADKNDARVTSIGKFIRTYRIDELPQLFNVLKGDMSLVGPRPEREVFVHEFSQAIPFFEKRMLTKPGITGLAQIYGRYNTRPEYKLRYDLIYIANFSILLDIRILILTLKVIFHGEGAH